ncbi:MAG: RNA methyltransferase [Chloroflexota bacterium]
MEPTVEITSTHNPRIKRVAKLAHRSTRDELRQTVVEGIREISLALQNGVVPIEAYICNETLPERDPDVAAIFDRLHKLATEGRTELIGVSPAVFEKIAYRGESGGVLLVVPYSERTLSSLTLPDPPLVVVVEDAEKPGNLGAILRTADAAGVDALIIPLRDHAIQNTRTKGTDIYNPNVIRASLGAAFTIPQIVAPAWDVIHWLREQAIHIVAAVPEADTLYTATDLTRPTAIVMGSEAWGLSDEWQQAADTLVRIPMSGSVDSLNLSTSTALLVYEAVRQRSLPG